MERDEAVARRRALRGLLVGAVGAFGVALLFPIRSLGPSPGQTLSSSPWHEGLRLVDGQDRPIRASRRAARRPGHRLPEGPTGLGPGPGGAGAGDPAVDPALGPVVSRWSPDGLLAYSKVCTHAGCPVSLYLADSHQLLCPCHQSSFDVLRGAQPVQGPSRPTAARSCRSTVDDEGYVVATGDFSAPIGPACWDRP